MPLAHLSFHTAGESHGRGLVAVVEGVPAGLPLDAAADIDPELRRRQGGHGRGRRMLIESDRADLLSGVRLGATLGSPISLVIWNKDWENWATAMAQDSPGPRENPKALRPVYLPRPGHADLVGVLKYDRRDARDVLERASARETAARVAAGAVARALLREVGVSIGSHVTRIGGARASPPEELPEAINAAADGSPVRTLDPCAERAMMAEIDEAGRAGDTVGGCFEVVARGLPVGLGSYVSWDRKLDGRLAQAVVSVHAVKGVEIGPAFRNAARRGSRVHDAIVRDAKGGGRAGGFARTANRAGGLEGGVTTGSPLVVRAAMKPLSTLVRRRLRSVDLSDGSPGRATVERSDVCSVPAAAVVAEAMVALVLADALLEKFGGDSLAELRRNLESYLERLAARGFQPRDPGDG